MCYGRIMAEEEASSPLPASAGPGKSCELPVSGYACPRCGEEVAADADEVTAGRGPFVRCPYCGDEFAVGNERSEGDREAEELRLRREREREAELSAMRIRQVATMRRATIRARSYLLIGAIAC